MTAEMVYERMARVQDALVGLEQAASLAMVGACVTDGIDNDGRNLLEVIREKVSTARGEIGDIADEVRDVCLASYAKAKADHPVSNDAAELPSKTRQKPITSTKRKAVA